MIRSDDEADYERDARPLPRRCARPPRWRPTRPVEVDVLRRRPTMRNNAVLGRALPGEHGGLRDRRPGRRPERRHRPTWRNVSWVCPTIHPDLAIAHEGTPGHSILFRDAAATPQADETTLLAATLVAQTAYELFADPELVEAAWHEFRGDAGPSPRRRAVNRRTRRAPVASGTRSRQRANARQGAGRRARYLGTRPARPAGRRLRTGGAPTRRTCRRDVTPRPSPEDPVAERPTTPTPSATSRPHNGWDREFEAYDDFDLPTYVGPSTFMKLPWVTDPAELRRRERRRRDRRRAVRRRGQPPTGRPLRAAGDPRGAVHVGLDQLAPARRRAVRGPDGRRCRRRQHRPGLDRARPRDDLPQGPRGRRAPARSRSSSAATTRSPGRAATAVAEVRRPGSIGIVHFDAHADTADGRLGRARRPRHADAPAHRVGRGQGPATSSRSACAATGRRSRPSSGCRSRACAGTSCARSRSAARRRSSPTRSPRRSTAPTRSTCRSTST